MQAHNRFALDEEYEHGRSHYIIFERDGHVGIDVEPTHPDGSMSFCIQFLTPRVNILHGTQPIGGRK